jgi:hypothetical protein
MNKRPVHVSVSSRECRGNHERMIKRFLKKTKNEMIIDKIKEKRADKKRSDRKRVRDELKQQRAQEKRNRNKR